MPAQRIASLLASSTEILYGLGLGDRVVGISHECDYPREAINKPRLTFTTIDVNASSNAIDQQVRESAAAGMPLYKIDVEKLTTLAPDLIVTQSQCDVCAVRFADVVNTVQKVPSLKRTPIVGLNPRTLEGIYDDIRTVADAAGTPEAADLYIGRLRDRVETVRSRIGPNRPRVACIEWIEPLMIAANWMPQLLELAGGQCNLTQTGVHSGYSKWEDVLAFDPQVIVVMPCGFDLPRAVAESATLLKKPNWNSLDAVKNRRVYAVDGNAYFNRSGPRIVDSLELLAGLIHPETYGEFRETYRRAWVDLSAQDRVHK